MTRTSLSIELSIECPNVGWTPCVSIVSGALASHRHAFVHRNSPISMDISPDALSGCNHAEKQRLSSVHPLFSLKEKRRNIEARVKEYARAYRTMDTAHG